MKEELKKFLKDHECFAPLKVCQENYILFAIDAFFNQYQPERSKREDSYRVEFGCSSPISCMTSQGKKTLVPGKKYDENWDEI